MTEKELKFLYKWAVQNSKRPLTDKDRELLKQAIDQAKTIEDLLAVASVVMSVN